MLASGGVDRILRVWDVNSGDSDGKPSLVLNTPFEGHRDTVSALAFREGTNTLFSGAGSGASSSGLDML